MSDPVTNLEVDQPPERQAEGLKTLRLVLWMLVALAAGAALYAAFGAERHAVSEAPVNYGDTVGGAFSLTAPDGSTVTDQTLKG